MATIVNNTIYIAYLKVAKRGDFKNPVYETAKETLMYRTVLWTL